MSNKVYLGNNIDILTAHPDKYTMVYIDPPFNTGKTQSITKLKTTKDENGDRVGFGGKTYKTTKLDTKSYNDNVDFDLYLVQLSNVCDEIREQLEDNGSLFVHLDMNVVHYVKVMLDDVFGRDSFMNEIIWAWDYGARSKSRWPVKHNNILWYAKNPDDYIFNLEECDRIEYMSPKLVGEEKTASGKTPTDTWWMSIEGTNSRFRYGYPTEKPYKLLERLLKVHSNDGDKVMDCFAGSGKFGRVALDNGREFVLVDNNPEAIDIMHDYTFETETKIEWIY